ncbi:MAG: hypothetical protein F4051_07600 [Boseongicola sp. SB0670_bin_30]|nr:hypothetical protein [Boseongicola sp. SB0670_bin_30]
MNSTLHLLPAALLVAVLAMAGCGGGGGDDMTEPTTPTEPTGPSAGQLSLSITAAENKANAAMKMADDAAGDAGKYSKMLSTSETAGDSKTAMMAAQAILDAEMDVGTALANAEAALADAEAAQAEVMKLADADPNKDALTTRINRVVEDAEMYVSDIQAIIDGTALKNAVAEVEGSNMKGTPRTVANVVGEAIAGALALAETTSDTNLSRERGVHGTDGPAATVAARLKLEMNDAMGMTWAMIVGEDNVMKERIGADNSVRMVASVAGMTASAVDADVTATGGVASGNTYADAFTSAGSTYKGIPGDIFCLGSDCEVDSDGKLAGSWYFSPTSEMAYYKRMADDTTTDADESQMYELDNLYVNYGHWLAPNGTDATLWDVNTFANHALGTVTNEAALGAASGLDGIDDGDKATYSGSAVGMSSRTQGSGDSKTTDSGRFTADVTLNASFGTAPTVRGTVNNFQGDATNSAWSVTLESATLGTTAAIGNAVSTGRDGRWSATAYGADATERPTGVFGGFSAHFSDGDAAGAYSTR